MKAVSGNKTNSKINGLIQRGQWEEARRLLERERDKEPTNHWVLTQLGVTFYEQRRHEEGSPTFSRVVRDCP